MKKIIATVLVFALLLAGGGYYYWQSQLNARVTFRTEDVAKGRLVAIIGSTGTVQAQDVVDVGAQVLGRIIYIGPDKNTKSRVVDWGSEVEGPVLNLPPITGAAPDPAGSGNIQITTAGPTTGILLTGDLVTISGVQGNTAANGLWYITVTGPSTFLLQKSISNGAYVAGKSIDREAKVIKQGTVLAQIDPALYAAQVAASKAQVLSAKADKLQKTATLYQANADFERAKKVIKTGGILQQEYDQYEAAFEVAKANLDVSIANIGLAEANLWNNQTNLEYCTVTAPVKGVVVDRRVNVGQTVVASLSAPSLFLIAKDLSKLEVWATVNEVDVSKISRDQDVTFTVDAFPGRVYKGKVVPQSNLPFRLNATMNQNVVTYTVVVSVDNEDRLLRPYMTTNLSFIVADKPNALLVPNAALRYVPARNQIVPEQRETYFQLKGKKRSPLDTDLVERGFVWTPTEDGLCRFIEIQIGLSDTVKTEVVGVVGGGALTEQTPVIVGETKGGGRAGGANPFAPQLFKSTKKE